MAAMTTDQKLVIAASALLDSGGDEAVTLRAVGRAVGVSHNAPYKHFESRNALLAAVAVAHFATLTDMFRTIRRSAAKPTTKLKRAFKIIIDCGHENPARYRLLFSNPDIAAQGGELERTALATFGEFAEIVRECQSAGQLPGISNKALTGLLFSTMHGLIDREASGRMRPDKGLSGVRPSMDLLIQLLSPNK